MDEKVKNLPYKNIAAAIKKSSADEIQKILENKELQHRGDIIKMARGMLDFPEAAEEADNRAKKILAEMEEMDFWKFLELPSVDRHTILTLLTMTTDKVSKKAGVRIAEAENKVREEEAGKRKEIASKGGNARKEKLQYLKNETIRMYENGDWMDDLKKGEKKNKVSAARIITPHIVGLSKNNNINLLPSTDCPLRWIREHEKTKKRAN